MLKIVLEKSRYLALIGVISSLVASLAAFGWGGLKTWHVIVNLFETGGKDPRVAIGLVELMDAFLIATALLIFALGLYELFVGPLALPEWLVIRDLKELKVKLASVVVLVIAVTFLSHLVEWSDPLGTLYLGVASALVSAALIAYGHPGGKD